MITEPIKPDDPRWLLPRGAEISITAAAAISRESFAFALSLGGAMYEELGDRSRFYRFKSGDWLTVDVGHYMTDMIVYAAPGWAKPGLALLSQQGAVLYLGDAGSSEQIADAGYQEGRDAPTRYGATTRIRRIGDEFYVCGDGGQLYRRAAGTWQDVAGLRNKPVADPQDSADSQGRLVGRPPFKFTDVGSPNGQDVYACGVEYPYHSLLYVRQGGGSWRRLPLKSDYEGLWTIFAEASGDVWIGGHDSLILRGNARGGFQEMVCELKGVPIESIVRYKGKLYAGGSLGLFRLDGDRFTPVLTERPASIRPGIGRQTFDDCRLLQVVDERLFMFGYQSIQMFDGVDWKAISIPKLVNE